MPPEPADSASAGRFSRLWRPVLMGLGFLFVVLGIVGLILPLMPGTVFLILAAACFTRSSPRFERWLLDHRHLGPPVRQWRESRSIPRHIKIVACVSLAVSWLILLKTSAPAAVKAGMLVLFAAIGAYVATRPETPSRPSTARRCGGRPTPPSPTSRDSAAGRRPSP